jgi:hypothetical protein
MTFKNSNFRPIRFNSITSFSGRCDFVFNHLAQFSASIISVLPLKSAVFNANRFIFQPNSLIFYFQPVFSARYDSIINHFSQKFA